MELVCVKPHDPGKLQQELYEAVPALKPVQTKSGWQINLRVFSSGDKLTLMVPDDADVEAIDAVVMNHSSAVLELTDPASGEEIEQLKRELAATQEALDYLIMGGL